MTKKQRTCKHNWGSTIKRERKSNYSSSSTLHGIEGKYRKTLEEKHSFSSLQSFCTKCNCWRGVLGTENAPELYISHLVYIFRKLRRVLRNDGTLIVNIGDSYAGSGKGGGGGSLNDSDFGTKVGKKQSHRAPPPELKDGDRVGIPERFALAMREDGWYWRDTIIWNKASTMPSPSNGWRWEKHKIKVEKSKKWSTKHPKVGKFPGVGISVTKRQIGELLTSKWKDCPGCDKCKANGGLILRKGSWRTTAAHEYIFVFARSEKYFADAQAVQEAATNTTLHRNMYSRVLNDPREQFSVRHDHDFFGSTRNPRSVRKTKGGFREVLKWINEKHPEWLKEFFNGNASSVQKFRMSFSNEAHYAAFPNSLASWFVKAFSSEKGCCPKCGSPWTRVISTTRGTDGRKDVGPRKGKGYALARTDALGKCPSGLRVSVSTDGWKPSCSCKENSPVPCIVADIFGGTGTTASSAVRLGRKVVLIELNPEYVKMQRRRLNKECPLWTNRQA